MNFFWQGCSDNRTRIGRIRRIEADKINPIRRIRKMHHLFLRATGLTQSTIRQMQHVQQAAALLRQGVPILAAVHDLGYFDQPHLTRSLKQFVGYTPGQLLQQASMQNG